jgi:hypothetical protein
MPSLNSLSLLQEIRLFEKKLDWKKKRKGKNSKFSNLNSFYEKWEKKRLLKGFIIMLL